MSREWVNSKAVAVIPLVIVGGLAISYFLTQRIFIECKWGPVKCEAFKSSEVFRKGELPQAEGKDDVKRRKVMSDRYSGRIVWLFLMFVNTLACVGALVASYCVLSESASIRREAGRTRAFIFIAISIAVGVYFWRHPDYMLVMKDVIGDIIPNGDAGMPVLLTVMKSVNTFSYGTSLLLVFA